MIRYNDNVNCNLELTIFLSSSRWLKSIRNIGIQEWRNSGTNKFICQKWRHAVHSAVFFFFWFSNDCIIHFSMNWLSPSITETNIYGTYGAPPCNFYSKFDVRPSSFIDVAYRLPSHFGLVFALLAVFLQQKLSCTRLFSPHLSLSAFYGFVERLHTELGGLPLNCAFNIEPFQ